MDALLAPVPAVDATSWRSALEEAKSKLAGLAVRRAGAVRFRVDRPRGAHRVHQRPRPRSRSGPALCLVRAARRGDRSGRPPFACCWRARRASPWRRCAAGWLNPPAGCKRAVPPPRSSTAGSTASPAARAAVGAEAVTGPPACGVPSTGRRSRRRRSSAATTGGTAPIPRSWRSAARRRALGERAPRGAVRPASWLGPRRTRPGDPGGGIAPARRRRARPRGRVVARFGPPGPGRARAGCSHPRDRGGGAGPGGRRNVAPIGRLTA